METRKKNKYKLPTKKTIKINKHKGGGLFGSFFTGVGKVVGRGAKGVGSATAYIGKGIASPFKKAITRSKITKNPDLFMTMLSSAKDKSKRDLIRTQFGKSYIKGLQKSASGSRGLFGAKKPNPEALTKLKQLSSGELSIVLGKTGNKKISNAVRKALPKAEYKAKLSEAYNQKNKYITELRKKGLGFFESRKTADRAFKQQKNLLRTERWMHSEELNLKALKDKRKKQWLITRLFTRNKYRRNKGELLGSIDSHSKNIASQQYKLETLKNSIKSRADIAQKLKGRSIRQKLLGSRKAETELSKQLKQSEKNLVRGAKTAEDMQTQIHNTKSKLKYIEGLRQKQKSYTGKMGRILKKDVAGVKRQLTTGTTLQQARQQISEIDKKQKTYGDLKKEFKSVGFRGKMNRRAKIEYGSAMKKMRSGKLNTNSVKTKMNQIKERRNLYSNQKSEIQLIKSKLRGAKGNERKSLKNLLSARQSARTQLSKSSTQGRKFGIFGKGNKLNHNTRMKSYQSNIGRATKIETDNPRLITRTPPPSRRPSVATPPSDIYATPQNAVTLQGLPSQPRPLPTTTPSEPIYATLATTTPKPSISPTSNPVYNRLSRVATESNA